MCVPKAKAHQLNDKQLFRDCGNILQSMKQYTEAAVFFEKGQQYDKAVTIYLQSKLPNSEI